MRKVTVKKVRYKEVLSLQAGVSLYEESILSKMGSQLTLTYYDNMLQLEILNKLFLLFRTKIESGRDNFPSISFTISQAVVLVYSCQHTQKEHADLTYANNVAEIYKNEIDQAIKSINV